MAWIQVDKTGYPAAACKNAIRSLAVCVSNVDRWFPTCVGWIIDCGFCFIFGSSIFTVQRPLAVRVPRVTMLGPNRTTTVALSKVAMHPASHSWPIDNREPDLMLGKMCIRHALASTYSSEGSNRIGFVLVMRTRCC